MHRFWLLCLFCLLAVLSGCGFHPRATLSLDAELGPVKVVTADPYSPLAQGLTTALIRAGGTPAVEGQPSATVRITAERMDTRPLSVDRLARVREYETRYIVTFELAAADGTLRVPSQEIARAREYVYDALDPAGSPAEQELLAAEMRRDMQAAILRRIDAVMRAR